MVANSLDRLLYIVHNFIDTGYDNHFAGSKGQGRQAIANAIDVDQLSIPRQRIGAAQKDVGEEAFTPESEQLLRRDLGTAAVDELVIPFL